MTLTPGTRLGAYEIRTALGAGGMGEVYRARDTKLDRDVAIKILPEAFADDPERVARFEREAKTLAAVNHPNIGAIYGLEEGAAEAGRHVRRGRWRVARVAAVTSLVVGGVAVLATWWLTRPAPPRVTRLTITTTPATALTINGNDRDVAITPDGSRVVYVGNNGTEVFVRPLDALESVSLFKGAPRGPFVSPNGQWVGFFDNTTILKKVAITGGPPVTIATLSWATTTPTTVVKAGNATGLAASNGRIYDVSPDGQRFLILKAASESNAPPTQLVVMQRFDEELKRLVREN